MCGKRARPGAELHAFAWWIAREYFGNLVDYGFTAGMEDDLDEIASGREEALPWLSRFYFGTSGPLPEPKMERTGDWQWRAMD